MKIINCTYLTVLRALFMLLCFSACTGGNEVPLPDPGLQDMRIRWNVQSSMMQQGRGLILDNDDLQKACTPNEQNGLGKSIGIWSACKVDGYQIKNVLGNPNGDVALTYQSETDWDNYEGWTYGEEAVSWTPKAEYTFNAYYPMEVVDEITSSDVSTFVVDYNTEHYQEDLMMAYAYANTAAPDFNASKPVELKMLHTLSALRFKFMFKNADNTTYNDNDILTACSLENTVSGSGIATTGVLAFGTKQENGVMDGEHIHWYHEDHPEPNTPGAQVRRIYEWEDKEVGVPFYSTSSECKAATSHTTGNGLYAQNEGWILTIPQELDGTILLCFKLKSTGDLVHHINLPATTLEARKRYTYNIRFGQTEVDVKLTIADWNELKSSYDIPL